MPAEPKPPRTPPKPRKRIQRRVPLPRPVSPTWTGKAGRKRTPVRAISKRREGELKERREVTRPTVLKRDGFRCRCCGQRDSSTDFFKGAARWLEVHEEPPRSLGGDPLNPADCITLCQTFDGDGCHGKATRHTLRITKGPEGCNAPVTFTQGERTWAG
jgi:hypothetical protein